MAASERPSSAIIVSAVEDNLGIRHQQPSSLFPAFEELFPDSGGETDDEDEDEDDDEDFPNANNITTTTTPVADKMESTEHQSPSSTTTPLRPSSTPVSAMRALDLSNTAVGAATDKENIHPNNGFCDAAVSSSLAGGAAATAGAPVQVQTAANPHLDFHHDFDAADGSHSSEEELEEINMTTANGAEEADAASTTSSCPTTSSEETTPTRGAESANNLQHSVSQNQPQQQQQHQQQGALLTPQQQQFLPQFSTSPPTGVHVHKPRRSSSPPAKMFLLDHQQQGESSRPPHFPSLPSGSAFSVMSSSAAASYQQQQGQMALNGVEDAGAAASVGDHLQYSAVDQDRRERRRTISPRKRYHRHHHTRGVNGNSSAHAHHHQRPCLDFEKMQQLKARAVTSWRHGGELSLFCW